MNYKIVTALFDIGREKYDGRSMKDYLSWFGETLKINAYLIIYTEERFAEFVWSRRSSANTEVIIQRLEDVPAFKYKESIRNIISCRDFSSRMKDVSRIECNLPDYNVIQYSKFGWLADASKKYPNDYYFWMDAGCSRFFGDYDISLSWPQRALDCDKITIQNNINFDKYFSSLVPETYMWDNECILVGTLFGGGGSAIQKLYICIEGIMQYMMSHECINNEQFALAILLKNNTDFFNIFPTTNQGHLPLFRYLSHES